MISIVLLTLLALAFAAGLTVPLVAGPRGDSGDGIRYVRLPSPRIQIKRVALFVVVAAAWSLAVAFDFRTLSGPVRAIISGLLFELGISGLRLSEFAASLDPLLILLMGGSLVAFQLVRKHSGYSFSVGWLIVAGFVGAVITFSAAIDGVTGMVGIPPTIAFYLMDVTTLALGFLALISLLVGTTALPRRYGKRPSVGSLESAGVAVFFGVILFVVGGIAFHLVGSGIISGISIVWLVVLMALPSSFLFVDVVLLLGVRRKERPGIPIDPFPSLDVIMPAFNEEIGIRATLEAIDRAAARYGGYVRVLVADDGSGDRTQELVRYVSRRAQSAEIILLEGAHSGKAGALNRALESATADIVIRIDADIIVSSDVFGPLPAWFANPSVGCVGAFDLPNPELPAWYTKGRLFECLLAFGFTRLGYERLDANNIPGTYMAFRRVAALLVGGFVDGMNGEDSDMTYNLGKMGLVSVLDRSIIVYEDVPQTLKSFMEQRTRWGRATIHLAARHLPATRHGISPRYVVQSRFLFNQLNAVIRPVTYLTALAFFLVLPRFASSPLEALGLVFVGFVLPQTFILSVLAIHYRHWRALLWLPLWIPFRFVRRFAMLSGLFSLPPYVHVYAQQQSAGSVQPIHEPVR
ncbi:MAG: glycosyltransferase family 2 protein [Ferrimicrobium sp.]